MSQSSAEQLPGLSENLPAPEVYQTYGERCHAGDPWRKLRCHLPKDHSGHHWTPTEWVYW